MEKNPGREAFFCVGVEDAGRIKEWTLEVRTRSMHMDLNPHAPSIRRKAVCLGYGSRGNNRGEGELELELACNVDEFVGRNGNGSKERCFLIACT